MELEKFLRKNYAKSNLHYLMCRCIYEVWLWKNYRRLSIEQSIQRKYFKLFGRKVDFQNPQTLNEKIQWLKVYDYSPFHTIVADKYAMKAWIAEHFGDEYNVPLLFHTDNWRDITNKNITQFPCIVKANHSSHDVMILRNEKDVNWAQLRRICRFWLHRDYYQESQELQYRDIPRQIVVEPLLQTKDGKLPNDYKLNYLNGQLEFVYVSIDREGVNARNVYDANWNVLPFTWDSSSKPYQPSGIELAPPSTFEKMKQFGAEIAKLFKYVRVDFYDVDGKLYFGEITLHHGGGFDRFRPAEYDKIFGEKLQLQ